MTLKLQLNITLELFIIIIIFFLNIGPEVLHSPRDLEIVIII